MEIDTVFVNKIPLFRVQRSDAEWFRVYGATYDKKTRCWFFPAYPPFLEKVLHDIEVVHKEGTFTAKAAEWIAGVGTFEEKKEFVEGYEFKGPYKDSTLEHQKRGLAEILYNHRWVLRWAMGTGKTKVAVDAVDILKARALVLCPVVAIMNWAEETQMHTEGTLSTAQMLGSSAQAKLDVLADQSDVDIFIVSYDVAARYGTPTLYREAAELFEKAKFYPTPKLQKALRRTNNRKLQARLAQEWIRGRKTKEIDEEVRLLVGNDIQWLSDLPIELLIADESHRFKSIRSKRTRAVLKLATLLPRRVWLTGTITLGDPRDMFPQMKALARYIFPENWKTFGQTYTEVSPRNDKIVIGYKNLHVLNRRLREVSSEQELEGLPGIFDQNIKFELSSEQMQAYNTAITDMQIERHNAEPLELHNSAIRITKLLQICSGFLYTPKELDVCDDCETLNDCVINKIHPGTPLCHKKDELKNWGARETLRFPSNPKLKALEELLTDILSEEGNKVIVWAVYEAELDDIQALLRKKKWGHVRVDGKNSGKVHVYKKEFQEEKNCRVYLAQISTGIAITLTAAAYTVYYSRTWELEDWEQSRGRNYRLGQTSRVMVYRLLARGSLERQQLAALDRRKDIAKTLTKDINCLFCDKHEKCFEKGIQPWTKGCILTPAMGRIVTRPGLIKPTQRRGNNGNQTGEEGAPSFTE